MYYCFRIALNSLVEGSILEEVISLCLPISSSVLLPISGLIPRVLLLEASLLVVKLAPSILVLRLHIIIIPEFHVLLKTRIYMRSFKVRVKLSPFDSSPYR